MVDRGQSVRKEERVGDGGEGESIRVYLSSTAERTLNINSRELWPPHLALE